MKQERPPIRRLWSLQDKIDAAIREQNWERATKLAKKFTKIIPLAANENTCSVGIPHLDGVFTIGTIRYGRAPDDAQNALNMMNRILRRAKISVGKKKRRRKKK